MRARRGRRRREARKKEVGVEGMESNEGVSGASWWWVALLWWFDDVCGQSLLAEVQLGFGGGLVCSVVLSGGQNMHGIGPRGKWRVIGKCEKGDNVGK